MAKDQGAWSAERLAARASVDALREMLGMDPLYNQKRVRQDAWLSEVRDAYYESRAVKTGPTRVT
jgi:hypothetical protein